MFPSRPAEPLTEEEFQQMLQIRLLTQLQPRLSRAVAQRILTLHNVEFSIEDHPAKLPSFVGNFFFFFCWSIWDNETLSAEAFEAHLLGCWVLASLSVDFIQEEMPLRTYSKSVWDSGPRIKFILSHVYHLWAIYPLKPPHVSNHLAMSLRP
jgi:hypothetical protein